MEGREQQQRRRQPGGRSAGSGRRRQHGGGGVGLCRLRPPRPARSGLGRHTETQRRRVTFDLELFKHHHQVILWY